MKRTRNGECDNRSSLDQSTYRLKIKKRGSGIVHVQGFFLQPGEPESVLEEKDGGGFLIFDVTTVKAFVAAVIVALAQDFPGRDFFDDGFFKSLMRNLTHALASNCAKKN